MARSVSTDQRVRLGPTFSTRTRSIIVAASVVVLGLASPGESRAGAAPDGRDGGSLSLSPSAPTAAAPAGMARRVPTARASRARNYQIRFSSDEGVLVPPGGRYRFVAQVVDARGRRVKEPIRWSSSDASAVKVSSRGVAQALAATGSATITAKASHAKPKMATVAIVQAGPQTVLIPSTDVVSVSAGQAVLVLNGITSGLEIGDIVASGSEGGLFATVTSIMLSGGNVLIGIGPASLVDAFYNLDVDVAGTPVAARLSGSPAGTSLVVDGRRIPLPRSSSSSVSCAVTNGSSVSVDLTRPSFSIPVRYGLVATLETEGALGLGGVKRFELAASATMSPSLNTGRVKLSGAGDVTATCDLDLPGIAVPSGVWLGPINLQGSITPSAGVEVDLSAQAQLTVAGPRVTGSLSTKEGIEYSAGSWKTIDENLPDIRVTPAAVSATADISGSFTAFARLDSGLSASVAGIFDMVDVNLAYAQASGVLDLTLASPFSPRNPAYAGPVWDARLELAAGVEVSLEGPVADLLEVVGVPPIHQEWTLFDLTEHLASSPTPGVGAAPPMLTSGPATLSASVPSGNANRTVKWIAYPSGGADGTFVASAGVSGLSATAVWSPTAARNGTYAVASMLYDGIFGTVGLPYKSGSTTTVVVAMSDTAPAITDFHPKYGLVGTDVVITGMGLDGVASVTFDGTSATYVPVSSTQITATVPAGATTGHIWVTTPGGTTASSGTFRVVDGLPGSQAWAGRYDGPSGGYEEARALGVSPDGSTVFVTGQSEGPGGYDSATTVAYDVSTGAELWVSRCEGATDHCAVARALGISSDGSKVFVTGDFWSGTHYDYTTIAYDSSNGNELWETHYEGPGGHDVAYALGVSPDGSKVFVTGTSDAPGGGSDYATVAYESATGNQLWAKRYAGPGDAGPADGYDHAYALGVSPDGSKVFVTGTSDAPSLMGDYATVAYDSATGNQLWVKRYAGPAGGYDWARSLGVSPDGSKVFVTGTSDAPSGWGDYATVAYSSSSGNQLWVKRYDAAGQSDQAWSLGVSPDGSKVFVTGDSQPAVGAAEYTTFAYDASSGMKLWAARYAGALPGEDDWARSLGVSPDGSKVFVTGGTIAEFNAEAGEYLADYGTVAYESSTGDEVWVARYDGGGNEDARALVVSPDGSQVFVTGQSQGCASCIYDYATVAYHT